MRKIAIAIALVVARPRRTAALAQQKPDRRSGASVDAAIKAAFPTAPADWQSRLVQDETMKQCSAHHNTAAEGGGRGDPEAREGHDRISGRRQADGRLEEGREARAVRLRPALHRLSAAQAERRQLLRLPPDDQGRRSATARSARACSNYGKIRKFGEAETKAAYEKIYNSQAAFRARTCRGSAPTRC